MKQAKIKSIMFILLLTLLCSLAVLGFKVTLTSPTNNTWQTGGASVTHTWVVNDTLSTSSLDWCAIYNNGSGTWGSQANITTGIVNHTNISFGLAYSDSTGVSYIWNVQCYNGSATTFADNNYTMGVDFNFPSTTLDSPGDNSYIANAGANNGLNFTSTDASNLVDCEVYTNMSGSWAINYTNASMTTGVQESMNISGTADGVYFWNVQCNQTSDNATWAEDSNRTFTIDSTAPVVMSYLTPANNTATNDTTPTIRWNQTSETNFGSYFVQISRNSVFTSVVQTVNITSISSNTTTFSSLPEDLYYVMVSAIDRAGNEANATSILYLRVVTTNLSLTLNNPANNSFQDASSVDFNVTVLSDDPDSCSVFLSNSSQGSISLNKTTNTVANNTRLNITVFGMTDGQYTYNIQCNDTRGNDFNVSNNDLDLTIDTTTPTAPNVTETIVGRNSTDSTPQVSWLAVTETNFERYEVNAYNTSNTRIFQANLTLTTANNSVNLTLLQNQSFYINVSVYDKAGNSNFSENASRSSPHYVDPICANLSAGWNLCGLVETTNRTLSAIANETNATFVSIWNASHAWSTCNQGSSFDNCNIQVGISNEAISNHVWVYVPRAIAWEDRDWAATATSANVTVTSTNNGWNIVSLFVRQGRTFAQLNASTAMGIDNITSYSLPDNALGTNIPFITRSGFNQINPNVLVNYGEAMWVFYNGTADKLFTPSAW
jgi:hypothetical protein